jgi:hypothetical protein
MQARKTTAKRKNTESPPYRTATGSQNSTERESPDTASTGTVPVALTPAVFTGHAAFFYLSNETTNKCCFIQQIAYNGSDEKSFREILTLSHGTQDRRRVEHYEQSGENRNRACHQPD